MNEKEKMTAGLLYDPSDEAIMSDQSACLEKMYEYNATLPHETERRARLLSEMLGSCGEGCIIEPPFRANWGGRHLHFGRKVYANFNLCLVDDADIYVGDHVMLGPNVTVATAQHPIWPEAREKGLQCNREVHIGRNVWIGAGAILLPGVSIGENSVIGAGSVVTRDIPANVVAVGNPCRILREISEKDRKSWLGMLG